ncbi:hypothetical protein GCM10009589_04210 [Arthrobacter pascens]
MRALASIGLDERDIQTSDTGTGIRFGASATGGCVRGSVGLDGTVQVVVGGYIMDGGCLAMNGHRSREFWTGDPSGGDHDLWPSARSCVGPKAIRIIEDALEEHGLALKSDPRRRSLALAKRTHGSA